MSVVSHGTILHMILCLRIYLNLLEYKVNSQYLESSYRLQSILLIPITLTVVTFSGKPLKRKQKKRYLQANGERIKSNQSQRKMSLLWG